MSSQEYTCTCFNVTKYHHVSETDCSWEFTTSLDFDWALISGKKRFNWPMVCLFNLSGMVARLTHNDARFSTSLVDTVCSLHLLECEWLNLQ